MNQGFFNFKSNQIELLEALDFPIQTGFQFRARTPSHLQTSYSLVQIKNTVRDILHYINLKKQDTISIPENKKKFMAKYILQENDVLYLSKLNPGAFRYKGSCKKTIIPSAHFYILRPKTDVIDSDYLCWILNQKFIKPYIQTNLKGTLLTFISKEALAKLKIPLPKLAVQKKITVLLKLRMKEKKIQKAIDKKKDLFLNSSLHKLL